MLISRRSFGLGLVALFSLFAANEVQSRGIKLRFGRGLARGLGRKNYTPDVLTQNQLEECLLTEQQVAESSFFETVSSSKISKNKIELETLQRKLTVEQATLDTYSQIAVDEYNHEVERFETMRQSFNSAVDEHNRLIVQLNQQVSRFNGQCASKKYYEDDMTAARAAIPVLKPPN